MVLKVNHSRNDTVSISAHSVGVQVVFGLKHSKHVKFQLSPAPLAYGCMLFKML